MDVVPLRRAVDDPEPEPVFPFVERVRDPPERLDAAKIRNARSDT